METGAENVDFQTLYNDHSGRVYGFLVRRAGSPDLAQDLLQEVFMRVFRYIHTYDPERGELSPWINRIAANTWYTHLKRTGKKADESALIEEDLADAGPAHTDLVDAEAAHGAIQEAIERLPEPARTVLVKTRVEGLTLDEAAEELGMSRRTVSRRLFDATKLLRKDLEAQNIL